MLAFTAQRSLSSEFVLRGEPYCETGDSFLRDGTSEMSVPGRDGDFDCVSAGFADGFRMTNPPEWLMKIDRKSEVGRRPSTSNPGMVAVGVKTVRLGKNAFPN